MVAVLIASAFGFFPIRLPIFNAPTLVVFVACATAFFFAFRYPLAFQPSGSFLQNLSNWICHSALAIGFGFFVHTMLDAGILGKDTSDLSSGATDSSAFWPVLAIIAPLAVGAFVGFFFQVAFRFDGILRFKHALALLVVVAVSTSAAFVVGSRSDVPLFMLSGLIVLFVGLLLVATATAAVSGSLALKKIIFDIAAVIMVLLVYFPATTPLFQGMSITGRIILQIGVFLSLLAAAFLLDMALGMLAGMWRAVFRRKVADNRSNTDNPSLILFLVRTGAGMLSNMTVFFLPVAWVSYWRFSDFFQRRLGGSYALEKSSRRLTFWSGVGAAITYYLTFSAAFVFEAMGGGGGPIFAACFGLAALVAWLTLRQVSNYYAARPLGL